MSQDDISKKPCSRPPEDAGCRTVLFPGSFDPFTVGHASLVERALPLFDRMVIAVGYNSAKTPAEDLEVRLGTIRSLYRNEPRIEVTAYTGLTVEACRRYGAGWILRGVRSVADFEYERNLADINRAIAGIETMVLYALPGQACVSSSMVRELASYGYDTSHYLPGSSE